MCHWTWPICRWLSYPLVMTNSSPWYRWPIEMDGLPSYKMVIFHGKLLVITRGYLKWWSFTSQQLPGGTPYPHQADRDRNQHPQQLIHNWGNKGGLLISLKRLFFFCDIQFFVGSSLTFHSLCCEYPLAKQVESRNYTPESGVFSRLSSLS